MKLEVKPYTLNFTFEARTSRGAMRHRQVWFLEITHAGTKGVGEAAPIPGLSPERMEEVEEALRELPNALANVQPPGTEAEALGLAASLVPEQLPSVRFALEVALLDWLHGGQGVILANDFAGGKGSIPINGLVWMSGKDEMIRQIDEKLEAGFRTIKLKVGALDFDEELSVLDYLRRKAPHATIRLDANGAFATNEVLGKLKVLASFDIHSIEQPIAPRQYEAMAFLMEKSPIPIALDEDLIGVLGEQREALLDELKPHYLVLKPSLLGGIAATREWIDLAHAHDVEWWITSYLESNIGLNAIAQLTGSYAVSLPQGLGTGMLFSNNLDSGLEIQGGYLRKVH